MNNPKKGRKPSPNPRTRSLKLTDTEAKFVDFLVSELELNSFQDGVSRLIKAGAPALMEQVRQQRALRSEIQELVEGKPKPSTSAEKPKATPAKKKPAAAKTGPPHEEDDEDDIDGEALFASLTNFK